MAFSARPGYRYRRSGLELETMAERRNGNKPSLSALVQRPDSDLKRRAPSAEPRGVSSVASAWSSFIIRALEYSHDCIRT